MLINNLKENNNNLTKLLANKRIRSLIYFFLWCIFIIVIYLVYLKPIENHSKDNITNNKQTIEDNIVDAKSFADMQEELLSENFAYIFTKNTSEGKIIYKGESLYDEKIGYKESRDGVVKYYIKGDNYYIINYDELTLISKEGFYEEYFDISNIFSLINNINPLIEDNIYLFQKDDINVKITIGVDNISQIEITNGDENYLLEFTNINSIIEIRY